jgi:hypothetical protein
MPHANEQPKGFGDAAPPHDAAPPPLASGLPDATALSAAPASVVPDPDEPLEPVAAEPPDELVAGLVPASDPELAPEPSGDSAEPSGDGVEAHPTEIMGAAANSREKCSLAIFAPAADPRGSSAILALESRGEGPGRLDGSQP